MTALASVAGAQDHRVPVVAQAICEFENGDLRTFYATRFSLVDMFSRIQQRRRNEHQPAFR
jgi:hypothetical protein